MFFKKQILKISLLFILILAGIFCGFTVMNYDTKESVIQNQILDVDYEQDIQSQGGKSSSNGDKSFDSGNKDPDYTIPLTVYSVIFFALAIGMYSVSKYKCIKINSKNIKFILFTVLGVGLLLRVAFGLLIEGFWYDISCFKTWAISAASGLTNFYLEGHADYPPLYIYVLNFVGKLMSISSLSGYSHLLIKIPSILADIMSAYIIYKLAEKYRCSETGILLAIFYIFNPAIFINSTLWGQVDSFFTLIIILAVYLMSESKVGLATMVFTIGVLMKPQGIIYFPILFFELVRKKDLKLIFKMAGISIGTVLVIIIPFSLKQSPLWILNLYSNTISEYPYASVNAFNFFTLIGGNFVNDTTTLFIFSYHSYGMFFIVLTTLLSWFIYEKGNDTKIVSVVALIQISGVFTFAVGMHERYLFPAAVLAILAYIYQKDKRFLFLAVGFSITIYLNTYRILYDDSLSNVPIIKITSLLNILLFGYLVKIVSDMVIKKKTLSKT